jgi:hypothetical protein
MLTGFLYGGRSILLVNHPFDLSAILIDQGQTWSLVVSIFHIFLFFSRSIYKISHTFTASAREQQSSVLVSG